MSSQVRVKVYHIQDDKSTKEIRRFAVDGELLGSFEYLIAKTKQVFPDLMRKDVELFWKDDEDDYINISTDEELIQALNSNSRQTEESLKFYAQCIQKEDKANRKDSYDEVHPGIACDSCDNSIRGIRYKCMECYDFDLCRLCEKKGVHPSDHEMIVIKTPRRSGNIFVTRVPPFPFSQRSQFKPWFCQPRKQQNCDKCPFESKPDGDRNAKDKDGSSQRENGSSTTHIKDMIEDLASTFGLDPEVAVSSMKVFFQNCQNQENDSFHNKDPQSNKKDDTEKKEEKQGDSSEDCLGEMLENVMRMFGLNEQVLSDVAQSMGSQMNFEKKEEKEQTNEKSTENQKTYKNDTTSVQLNEENIEKTPSFEKDKDEEMDLNKSACPLEKTEEKTKNDKTNEGVALPNLEKINGMAADFFKQNSMGSEQGIQSSLPYANLGQLVNTIFQKFHSNDKNGEESKASTSNSEDHVLLDNGDKKNDEERYNQRLEKALKQMETMGFDNDGGWLRQLLISKDLSIARVLDALNP